MSDDIAITAIVHSGCRVDGVCDRSRGRGCGYRRWWGYRSRLRVDPVGVHSAILPRVSIIRGRKIESAGRRLAIATGPVTESSHAETTNLGMPGMRGSKFYPVFEDSQCGA